MRAVIVDILTELGLQIGIGLLLLLVAAVYSLYLAGAVLVTIGLVAYVVIQRATTKIADAVGNALKFTPKF